jgi:hypothetical protein
MMTFIVVGDLALNAELLDNTRLGKQRVEALQIINAILGNAGAGWRSHPATLAWKPYLNGLKYYANCIIAEWVKRGNNNNMPYFEIPSVVLMPWWVKWDKLHQSHRAMLMRKDPFYYRTKFTVDPEYMQYGYIWPHSVTNRDLPLDQLTAPIPDYLLQAVYCPALLKSGVRKGQSCNRIVKDAAKGHAACTIHR